jgi:arylsulfatase A-like enzyme
MNKDVETLAGLLKQRGYTTYAVTGCAPLHSFRSGLAKDFDVYIDGGNEALLELEAGIMTRRSLKLFEQGLQEPFLFWIHFPDPHQPHHAVKGFDFRDAPPPGPERRKIEDAYDSEIAYCDHNAGLLLDDLKKRGLLENTLIVMTADHGEHLGGDGKGTTGHGRNLSQGVLQMPMVMTGPGIPAGKLISEPVQTLDFAPTILDYLGLPKGERMMGRSLMAAINQDAALDPIPFFFESYSLMVLDVPGRRWIGRHSPAVVVGMRDQNFKLIHLINKNIWEMYDLGRDPEENTNIFAPGDPDSMRMARELMDWYAQRDRGEKPLVLPD